MFLLQARSSARMQQTNCGRCHSLLCLFQILLQSLTRLKAEVGALLSGSMGIRAFRSQSVNRAGNTVELLMDGGCREKT